MQRLPVQAPAGLSEPAGLPPTTEATPNGTSHGPLLEEDLDVFVPTSEPARNGHGTEPAALQRWSPSDLNPLNAAKRLAEKALGAIRSLGNAAVDAAQSLGGAALNTAKTVGGAAWNTIKSAGAGIGNAARALGTAAWTTAKSVGTSAWTTAKSVGTSTWTTARGLGTKAWSGAKAAGSRAWSTAKALGTKAWGGVKALGARAWHAVRGAGSRALKGVRAVAGKALTTAAVLGGKALAKAKSFAGKAMGGLCKAVGALVAGAIAGVTWAAKKAWQEAKRLGKKAWGLAKGAGAKLWNGAKSWGKKAWGFAKGAATKAWSGAKALAGKAWGTAKALGSKAWSGAKALATGAFNRARQLGGKALDTAKRLGTAAWDKTKALGAQIGQKAKAAGAQVLGIADKLTGGAASKVAGMASKVLGKAAGLLSFVMNIAKSLATKATSTAKSWASKALSAAKDLGTKAFETARGAATNAFNTAKSWGSKATSTAKGAATKAFSTAKGWGSKAISTAKSWGSKAWGAAKSLGSKAISTAKSWGSKAWGAAKAVGGKVVDFAKGAGRTAVKVAKAVGLDKAWNTAKKVGGKAIGVAKSAAAGLKKRFGPVAASLGKAAAATVVLPVGIVCAILKCPPVSKFCDLLKRFGRFLSGAKKVMTNPGVVIGAIKQSLGSKIEQVPERAKAATTRAVTFSEPASSHLSGIWRHLEPKLEYLKDHWWDVIKETVWGLLWPWPGVFGDLKEIWSEIKKAWGNIRSLRWSDLLDNYLTIQQLAIGTLGRLYGWFLIASVLIGAIIGAFFGGAGAIPGAGAGLAFAGEVGKGLLIADVAAQSAIIGKAGFDLAFRSQSVGERENDYEQIASSGLTLAITGALMLLGAIAFRIAKALFARVRNLFRGRSAEKVPIKPPVREPASPNKPPHEARIRESEPIRTSDGHEVKVAEDGQLVRCSEICQTIRIEHEETLRSRPDLDAELAKLEEAAQSPDPVVRQKAAEDAARLRERLNAVREAQQSGPPSQVASHSNFKAHYQGDRVFLERLLGKKYPRWKVDEGAEFLTDLTSLINTKRLKLIGPGTIKKGQPWAWIYRGEGLTLVLRQNGSYWTLLKSGKAMDLGIVIL